MFVVPDTNVLISLYRAVAAVAFKERQRWRFRVSSVVESELLRGVSTEAEARFVTNLVRAFPPIAPSVALWRRSGELLSQLREKHGYNAAGLRRVQNDVLIALTARSMGYPVLTANVVDFALIAKFVHDLEVIEFCAI